MKTTVNVFYCDESKVLVYRTKEGCWIQFIEDLVKYPTDSIFVISDYTEEENIIIMHDEGCIFKEIFSFDCTNHSEFSLFEKEVIQKTLKKILENAPEILL